MVAGVKCVDGIVLAGTKNVSYGYLVVSQAGRSVYVIDRIGLAFAGHVADLQSLVKEMEFELRYAKLRLERELTTEAVAHRLGLILYSWKLFPHITFALVGGIDRMPQEKPRLFSLDPVGSVIEENYAASGTSAEVAIGILEDRYDPKMPISEGKKILMEAMKAVARRDVLAGRYIDLAVITKDKSSIETIKLDV